MTKARNLADFISDATVATAEIENSAVTTDKLADDAVTAAKLDETETYTTAGLTVNGNIAATGTVDGRDVAADGTKLDGIEASADVTDTTNVTAAGALMTTGGSVTGNVSFGDNDKAIFGAGSDLQIYHDGGASYVQDTGTGALYLQGDGGVNIRNAAGTENKAVFASDGAVTLYYNNAAKFATTSTGVDITGTLTSDSLTVDGDILLNGDRDLHLVASNPNAGTSFQYGEITLGDANTSQYNNHAKIISNGNYANQTNLEFHTSNNNSSPLRMKISEIGDITFYDTSNNASFVYDESAGSTFNEQGADRDFRVESDGNTHMLFVNAGDDKIGIQTSGPLRTVDIEGPLVNDGTMYTNFRLGTDDAKVANRGAGISFGGNYRTSGNTPQTIGHIAGINGAFENGTDANYASALQFYTRKNNGSLLRNMIIGSSATVINEGGNDYDFRVESDANTHMLFMDAGLNQVRIGSGTVNAPSTYPFISYAGGTSGRSAFVHSAGDGGVVISGSAGGSQAALILGNNWGTNGASFSEEWRILMDGTYDALQFNFGGSSTALNLSSGGQLTTYYNSAFNENGGDYDFRVESDSNANAFIVDASQDNVGIGGTPNINTKLDVYQPVASGSWTGRIVSRSDVGTTWLGTYTNAGYSTNGLYSHNAALTSWADLYINAHSDTNGNPVSGGNSQTIHSVGTWSHSGHAVFNEYGLNYDFRVESDGNANAIKVDAGNNRIGFFNAAPSAPLHLIAGTSSTFSDAFQIGDGTYTNIAMYSGAADGEIRIGAAGALRGSYKAQYAGTRSAHDFHIGSNSTNMISFDGGGSAVIVNETGADRDFRVESNNATHMFYVDSTNDRIGINTNTPAHMLNLAGAGDVGIHIQADTNNSGENDNPYLSMGQDGSSSQQLKIGLIGEANQEFTGSLANASFIHANNNSDQPLQLAHFGEEVATLYNTVAVFNERGGDQDFRVESDNNANMLRVDAQYDAVVVGSSGVSLTQDPDFAVNSFGLKSFAVNSNTLTDTGISVNQDSGGMACLVMASNHYSAGTATRSAIYHLNFYYSGNNAPAVTLLSGTSGTVGFGVSANNTLTVQMPAGGNAISFLMSG